MAKLKLPNFNEGSLLQRTLLYVATFVVGSVGFVALASFLVVWAAKAALPSHSSASGKTAVDDTDKAAELAAATSKAPIGKGAKSKRGKVVDAAPAEEAQ